MRNLPFETAIIERYRCKESSVKGALVEMYMAGISARRVEEITRVLWETRVSPSTVSDLPKGIYECIAKWRNEAIVGKFSYVFVDGIWLKRNWEG